jgi:hypothetical protein
MCHFTSTKRHLEQVHILHINQLKDETNFGLNKQKSCEAPPPPQTLLIITYLCTYNLYHKTYIQNCPLYTIHKI